MAGWLLSLPCTRAEAEHLSGEVPALDALDDPPVVVTREIDEASGRWQLDCYFNDRPGPAVVRRVEALVPSARGTKADLSALPDDDWITLSQQGLEPVRAGRFYVHTADNRGVVPPGSRALQIDAGLAFGTGGHATTAGCLAMLDRLARRGARFRNIADIGSGTGVLAFAALHLWPGAAMLASDIDPVSVDVLEANAVINGLRIGAARGQILGVAAAGTDHVRIKRRAPYDLLIANILAGPLITLAPDFAAATRPDSFILLAGLIAAQERAVLAAYSAQGFRLAARNQQDEWPCLLLVRRPRYGWRRSQRARHRTDPADASFGSW